MGAYRHNPPKTPRRYNRLNILKVFDTLVMPTNLTRRPCVQHKVDAPTGKALAVPYRFIRLSVFHGFRKTAQRGELHTRFPNGTEVRHERSLDGVTSFRFLNLEPQRPVGVALRIAVAHELLARVIDDVNGHLRTVREEDEGVKDAMRGTPDAAPLVFSFNMRKRRVELPNLGHSLFVLPALRIGLSFTHYAF